jgi:hypothetical protein
MAAEDVDYIATEHQTMLDFHGKYTFLIGDDRLDLFETEKIKDLTLHPTTERKLTPEEIAYVLFHNDCYRETKNLLIDQETLNSFVNWYFDMRKGGHSMYDLAINPETKEAYNIVRFFMSPTDFQSHFRNFNPQNSTQETYERDLAEKALRDNGKTGSWLLRHSSYNRPVGEENQRKLKRMGIRYYALSYISFENYQIQHDLIKYSVGKGYTIFETKNFTNFMAALEYLLDIRNLSYAKRIGNYYTTQVLETFV